MTPQAWKQRVADSFEVASADYEQQARIQRQVATELARRIAATVDRDPIRRALEIGCGTGFLTRPVTRAFPDAGWTITDVAPGMLRQCRRNLASPPARLDWQLLDGERVSSLGGQFDLICSNLAFQWFSDLESALARLMRRVRGGGWLIFTTLASDSFSGVSRQFPELRLADRFARYSKRDSLQQFLDRQAGWQSQIESKSFGETHGSLGQFIAALKAIGAGTSWRPGETSTSALRSAIVRSNRSRQPVEAEYRVLFAALQNRSTA